MIWWNQKFSVFIYSVTVSVDFTCSFQMVSIYASIVEQKLNLIIGSLLISLRRQVTFGNAATGFSAKLMMSEKRVQKFHTDDVSLSRSGKCFWLVESNFPCGTNNQKHYPDLGSETSSVWNFCTCFSDVIWQGNHW